MARAAVLGRLTWTLGEVVDTIAETPTVKSLVLSMPNWSGHRAGQHVDVRLTAEDGYEAQRSYSIGSAPEQEHLTLTIERLEDGEVSMYLVDELRVGDLLELRGPIGGYFVWESRMGGPLLLVAGGSGIVPLMAMIRHHSATASDVPVRLLYSTRSFDDVIYREDLARFANSDSSVEISYTLTRSQPTGWRGYSRRIDKEMLEEVALPVLRGGAAPLVYICGPTSFVETAASLFVEMGLDSTRIRTERFGPTGGSP
jgi:ferredoxin-NADP reductase